MTKMLQRAATTRMSAIQSTDEKRRRALAQHLTPSETAALAASMFSELNHARSFIKCLDLGAGTGILSIALYDRYNGRIEQLDAVEIDPVLATIYEAEMASIGIPHEVFQGDALVDVPSRLYDRIILNPPYKKMPAGDARQSELPCRCANLYSAFIAVGLTRLAENGELVAIVPRSWMNGDYFAPFRRYALGFFSLDAMHVYGSRTEVFSDTKVLQETMLVKFSNRRQAERIKVTQSFGKSSEITVSEYFANDLIDPFTLAVRIAPRDIASLNETVGSVGLCPSTGKVVDFRSKERVYETRPDCEVVFPMVYAGNFSYGKLDHPKSFGKPQWYRADDEKSERQLTLPGAYVVVKRFSSKEENRRVTAFPLIVDKPIALENHLNYIHAGSSRKVVPLRSKKLAEGLALWLNSTFVDQWFRDVSGSTQVNASDIKMMPCPTLEQLEEAGGSWIPGMPQADIDKICEGLK